MSSGELERGLERALRECLTRRAAHHPAGGRDLADAAVRRAGRTRRRRSGAGVLALVLVLVVSAAAAGVVQMGHGSRGDYSDILGDARGLPGPATGSDETGLLPEPMPFSGPARQEKLADHAPLPVDVVVAASLHTSSGQSIDVSEVVGVDQAYVDQAYRVPDGWLVVSSRPDGRSTLWKVTEQDRPKQVLSEVERLVFAPDGRRLAWRANGRVYQGSLGRKGRVDARYETGPMNDAAPVGFVGPGVLLVAAEGERYDVWWPHLGPYEPTQRAGVTGIYGALPDGRTVVGQVAGRSYDEPCLALLDASAELAVRERACDVPLNAGSAGWLSPDGRWLVAEGAVEASVLIDLAHAFDGGRPAQDAGPGPYGLGAWLDRRTLVYAGAGPTLVRVHSDQVAAGKPGAVEEIPLAAGAGERVVVVPQLG